MAGLGIRGLALFISMAVCAAESPVKHELEELKADIWAGYMEFVKEVKDKMDSFDPDSKQSFKEFITPDGEKHGKPIGQKIKAFKESHPTVDVSPQALITLSTEEQGKLGSKINWLCMMGTP